MSPPVRLPICWFQIFIVPNVPNTPAPTSPIPVRPQRLQDRSQSPVSAVLGWPQWYRDFTGLVLNLCTSTAVSPNGAGGVFCVPPEPDPTAFPGNIGAEAFYFLVSSAIHGHRTALTSNLTRHAHSGAGPAFEETVHDLDVCLLLLMINHHPCFDHIIGRRRWGVVLADGRRLVVCALQADIRVDTPGITLRFTAALEAAYAQGEPLPGDEVVFSRIRIRAEVRGVGGTFVVQHPYGREVGAAAWRP